MTARTGRLVRLALWLSTLVLLTLLGAALAFAWIAVRAEPEYRGEVALPGLAAQVTIDYGPHAIPTIRASSLADLLFAQGYATAAERLWQMDVLRRAASGRLAEAFGERALPIDRLMRTIGLERAAERDLAVTSPPARRLLEAYAAGVNAYRDAHPARRPLEHRLAGLDPAPWTPADSLVIGEYMGYLLSFNAREELAFLRVAERIGAERARELFPTDEGVPADPAAPELAELLGLQGPDASGVRALDALFAEADRIGARLGLPRPGPASNAWAVAGSRTADGRPILASDPHLVAAAPNIWYEQELIAPGLHVAGASIPGLPLVLIGHNADLAWGLTTSMADTQDLVIERPTADGSAVLRADGVEPVRERRERIAVRGGEPVGLLIRATDNGVLLNSVLAEKRGLPQDFAHYAGRHLIALRSTLDLPDTAFDGLWQLNTATSLAEARAAAGLFVRASQNLLLAHRDGGIAWQITGKLPRRSYGRGTFPVPGWVDGYAWQGYLPATANPGRTDPPDGQLVSANHRTVALDHPVAVGGSWLAPYRAQRIEALLGDRRDLDLDDMAAIQHDRLGIEARHYQAALRALAGELSVLDPAAWRDAQRLLAWDARFTPDSQAAALFVLLRRALFHALLEDELGAELPAYMGVALLAYNGLQEVVRSGRSSFWDDVSTAQAETPAEIWRRALNRARRDLDAGAGSSARLGELRRLVFPHAFSGRLVPDWAFGVGPLASGGDDYTVDVRKTPAAEPQRPVFIPGYRLLATPGNWAASRSVQALGQSGHRFSAYRDDQLADWRAGRHHRLPWNGPPAGDAIGRLRLLPGRD